MTIKEKRQAFVLFLMFIFWGMFPAAYRIALHQRGRFAVGGEYCLLILPFVIAELVFTVADLKREAKGWSCR